MRSPGASWIPADGAAGATAGSPPAPAGSRRRAGGLPRLSARLRALAEAVPAGARVADVGTDHALLPAYLVLTGRCPRAVAVELRPGPLMAARRTLARLGVGDRVELRRGDGLRPLRPGEVDTVVIAGLGGETIAAIMAACPEVARTVSLWVLQPARGADALRRYLRASGFDVREREVADGRRRHMLLMAERATPAGADEGEVAP